MAFSSCPFVSFMPFMVESASFNRARSAATISSVWRLSTSIRIKKDTTLELIKQVFKRRAKQYIHIKETPDKAALAAQTLSNINAAGKAAILQPIPNATPVAVVEYTEGEIFGIDVTQAAGSACTCTADIYGTLIDAS